MKIVTDKVVDASALAAIVFNEARREAIERRLVDVTMIAPPLLSYEMASVCLKKMRAHPGETLTLIDALGAFERIPIIVHNVDLAATIVLAQDKSLSFYDASYLWLARSLGCELVTLDVDLQKAFDG